MDAPKYNQDNRPPWSKERTGLGVYPPCFNFTMHIFWGPGQDTTEDGLYIHPKASEWKSNQLLMIPQVIRFIYATEATYDEDKYNDSGVGPSPDPDPVVINYEWTIISKPVNFSLRSKYRSDPNLEVIIDPASPVYGTGGDRNFGVEFDNLSTNVVLKDGDTEVYNGPISGSNAYFRFNYAREILWKSITTGGTNPPDGTELPIADVLSSMGYQGNPADKPRCWSPFLTFDVGLDEVRAAPENGYSPSEVPFVARNWYGCSDAPDEPEVHPPPPNPPPPPGP